MSRSLLTGCRGGVPDTHTAARQLIKDYVDGKLRFCHLPPGQGAVCPGVNLAALSSAAGKATGLAANGLTSSLEWSDAAVGAGDKDVRLAVQGAREKVVFQMDAVGNGDAGVAVGQTNARRKGRENRALSAGVWADASEADLLKKEKEVGVMVAKGGKKKKHAFSGRPDRPYSVVPVRDASGRPLSRQEQMAAVGGVRVAAAH